MTRIQFDESPPEPRRWRFLLPAAVVIVAALLLWSSLNSQSDASTPVAVSSSTVLGDRVWALANDASAHASEVMPDADADNMPCDENGSELPVDAKSARAAEARWRAEALKIEASMIASHDEHVRAAGWFIRAGRSHIDARGDSESALADCKGRDCEQQVRDAAWVRARAAALPAANQLAAMATSSQDAMVYATAMRACSLLGDKREGACSMVNAEQLARLDPENLWAWFEVVGAAGERKDSAAMNDAIYRASLAKRADSYWGTVAALGLAAWPRGTSTTSKMFLTAQVATIEVMTGIGGGYQNVSKACAPEALAVGSRREQCDHIATTLVTHGSTMQDFGAGTGVGEQLGWSPERIAGLRKESTTLRAALAEAWIDAPGVCAGMRRFNEITRDVGRFGELGAARLALKRSPHPDGAPAERRSATAPAVRAAASPASAQ